MNGRASLSKGKRSLSCNSGSLIDGESRVQRVAKRGGVKKREGDKGRKAIIDTRYSILWQRASDAG